MFEPIKPKRVTEEIMRQIRDLIAQGQLGPGDKLPAEREMAQKLGVSRPTVREALQALESAGLLESVQGSGTFVRDIGEQALRDPLCSLIRDSGSSIIELAEFRTAIETWAVGLAARRIDEARLEMLHEIIREMRSELARGRSVHGLDAEFHITIAKATDNNIYFHVANTIFYLFAEVTRLSHQQIFTEPEDQRNLFQEHYDIYEAISSRDAVAARKLMRRHLSNTESWFKRRGALWKQDHADMFDRDAEKPPQS